eukprot:TRINITY_DN1631_c0_g1_i1.p1 TRINITY_DN1631_c0_g1~~TRINITY_DN1631_c0_g1_i1.p1  ORF type:complete len:356 (+),score=88.69 TRINITY_DN1631_c0_g1_i1:41-1108(+)
MLWVDEYRPKTLNLLDYHDDLTQRLSELASRNDFPHLLFYGPSGVGKKTRILAFLREIFGNSVNKVKIENRSFPISSTSKTTFNISILTSPIHIELNPSDVGIRDRVVVQELVKSFSKVKTVFGEKQDGSSNEFKVLILNEVDKMSKLSQQALRRTMEIAQVNCRFILITDNFSSVLEPLRSRCLCIRVPGPSDNEMIKVLQNVAIKEQLTLNNTLRTKIVQQSRGNMRKALLLLELAAFTNSANSDELILPDWEKFAESIVVGLLEEQTAQRIGQLRDRLFELLASCIAPETLFNKFVEILIEKVPAIMPEVIDVACKFQHNCVRGNKPIFHLEAFIAHVMQIYRSYRINNNST